MEGKAEATSLKEEEVPSQYKSCQKNVVQIVQMCTGWRMERDNLIKSSQVDRHHNTHTSTTTERERQVALFTLSLVWPGRPGTNELRPGIGSFRKYSCSRA